MVIGARIGQRAHSAVKSVKLKKCMVTIAPFFLFCKLFFSALFPILLGLVEYI